MITQKVDKVLALQAKDLIMKANDIVITAHVSPDGDAVGSCLGMYFALEQLRKNVDIVI